MYQSHGYAFPLAAGLQHQPETIPIFTGAQAPPTMPTTGQNFIQRRIIAT
jgi:hypothetical protein